MMKQQQLAKTGVLIACAMLISGCKPDNQSQSAKLAAPQPSKERMQLGRDIFNFRCYYCHGYSGNAKTLAASFLTPPPMNFTTASLDRLTRERMIQSVTNGRPHTAMKSFKDILQPTEIEAVVDFIRYEFMTKKAENTRYHTAENGWSNHERYADAYPFALGQIALDTPWEQLTEQQANGKRFFLSSCVSCHDRAKVNSNKVVWESRPLSYPRNNHAPGDYSPPFEPGKPQAPIDAMGSASPYRIHDIVPKIKNLTPQEQQGEVIFQQNCAFCHAADGTAKNWIGSFMEPHPRNLTDPVAMKNVDRTRLHTVIREGIPNTSMPAWKTVLDEQQIQAVIAYVARAFHPMPEETAKTDNKIKP